MRNNSEAAKGKGYPLKITATEIRVDNSTVNDDKQVAFVKGVLGMIDWDALTQGASEMGLSTLPPTLTEHLANDQTFLKALFHVLMNVHLVKGMLTCPISGREFPVCEGIPNMMFDEEECERIRM